MTALSAVVAIQNRTTEPTAAALSRSAVEVDPLRAYWEDVFHRALDHAAVGLTA